MTAVALTLYGASSLLELAGVVLVVLEVTSSRTLWDRYSTEVEQERTLSAADLRYQLDPFTTRYGLTSSELRRAVNTVASLLEVDLWRQRLTVIFLLAGIVVGLAGDVVGQIA